MVIFLLLSVLGIYSYRFLLKTVYSDFLAGDERYISSVKVRHENDLQITENVATQIGLLDETTRFFLSEQPKLATELIKTIKGYTTVSQFFEFMMYHYHEDDFFYHSQSSMGKYLLREYGAEFSGISVTEFLEFSTVKKAGLHVLPEQKVGGELLRGYLRGNSHIIFARSIKADYQDSLVFFVPGSYYDSLMAESENRISFLSHDDSIFVVRGQTDISENELTSFHAKEALDEGLSIDQTVQKEVKIAGERYLLTAQKGKSGIVYGTLQSMKVYHDKVMTEQWTVFFVIVLCALFAGVVIIFSSKSLVKRIKRLGGLLKEESSYDLDRIESGIQTLISTYRETEKEGLILKKTRFIRNFIRGDFESRERAVQEAEKAGFKALYDRYLVVLLRSKEITNENKAFIDMLEEIENKAELDGYGVHLINNDQNVFVLFSDDESAAEEVLQRMLEIGKSYSSDYVVACSDYHMDYTEVSQAYLEAVNAFDNYLLLDNSKIIRFTEVAHEEYVSILPESYLKRLKQDIRTGEKQAVEQTVKDICSKLNREKVSLYSFRIFYNDIIHLLLSERKGDKAEFDHLYNVFTLSRCTNLQEFGELLCDACNMIIDSHAGKSVNVSGIVEEGIAYMKKNYQNSDLTMNALAEHLGISTVTLSVEFKNEMDVKPSDYLANLRMEKAKDLLKNTNLKVKDVSLSVGYEDGRVFLKRFKKYTGMTPGEYRNS